MSIGTNSPRHYHFVLGYRVHINGKERAETWMNATANGVPVIPRTGYVVEINALWYNALMFVADLTKEFGKPDYSKRLETLAAQTGKSFVKTFLNQYGYLYDFVDKDEEPEMDPPLSEDDGAQQMSEDDGVQQDNSFMADAHDDYPEGFMD